MCCSSNTGQGSSSSIDKPTDSFVTLRKGYDIGYLEEVAEIFEDPDEAIVDEKSADSSEKDLYEQSTTHLDLSECIILAKFIKEFQDIFATSDDDLGCCTVIEHEIDTGDAKPVHQQMRHISKEFEGEAEKYIQKM